MLQRETGQRQPGGFALSPGWDYEFGWGKGFALRLESYMDTKLMDTTRNTQAASAPITQDVMTIPRKLPEGKINLVGLTREAMREALIAHGAPEKQAKMRVGQIWQWIYQWGVRDFAEMTNLSKDYRAELAEQFCD